MKRAVTAGIAYWALIFGLGFILGTIRSLWLAPLLGSATVAVALELPFMLTASWFAATVLVRRYGLRAPQTRAAMGALAFVLLMAAEVFLEIILSGDTLQQWFTSLLAVPGFLGLAGQLLFGLMPIFVRIPDTE